MYLTLSYGKKTEEYVSEDFGIVLAGLEGKNLVVEGENDSLHIHLWIDKKTYDMGADLWDKCYFDVSVEELKMWLLDLEDNKGQMICKFLPVFLASKTENSKQKAAHEFLIALTANYAHRLHMRRIIHEKQPLSA